MHWDELKSTFDLKVGDIVRHKSNSEGYVVTDVFGSRVTAVRTVDISHANEWLILNGNIGSRDPRELMAQAVESECDKTMTHIGECGDCNRALQ